MRILIYKMLCYADKNHKDIHIPTQKTILLTQNTSCTVPLSRKLLKESYNIPLPGWQLTNPQPTGGPDYPTDEHIAYEQQKTDARVFIDYFVRPGAVGSDAENTTAVLEAYIQTITERFSQTLSMTQPLPCTLMVGEQAVEFYYTDVITENLQHQQYKSRRAARLLGGAVFSVHYSDTIELWSEKVWQTIITTLKFPGVIVSVAANTSVAETATPLSPAPPNTPTQPIAAPIPTLPTPSMPVAIAKPRPKIIPFVIIGICAAGLLATSVGFLIKHKGSGTSKSTAAPPASQQDTQTPTEQPSQVIKYGDSATIGSLAIKVTKVTQNYKGEATPLNPGDLENYVHVNYTVKNTSSQPAVLSSIHIQALINGKLTAPDYNPEPDNISDSATIPANSEKTFSTNILLTSKQSLSDAQFYYFDRDKTYAFNLQ